MATHSQIDIATAPPKSSQEVHTHTRVQPPPCRVISQKTVIVPVLGTTVYTPLVAVALWARCSAQLRQSVQASGVGDAEGEGEGASDGAAEGTADDGEVLGGAVASQPSASAAAAPMPRKILRTAAQFLNAVSSVAKPFT